MLTCLKTNFDLSLKRNSELITKVMTQYNIHFTKLAVSVQTTVSDGEVLYGRNENEELRGKDLYTLKTIYPLPFLNQ